MATGKIIGGGFRRVITTKTLFRKDRVISTICGTRDVEGSYGRLEREQVLECHDLMPPNV